MAVENYIRLIMFIRSREKQDHLDDYAGDWGDCYLEQKRKIRSKAHFDYI